MKKILLFSGIGIILIALVIIFWGSIKRLFIPQNNQTVLTYLPFKEDKDDRWGLIDMNGNVIIENEWENEPSFAQEGIIRVKNKDGLYEFYTAEEKPKKIGEEYKSATLFYDGLAAVSLDNSYIFYINKKGKKVFELKDYKGKVIELAGNFVEGLAVFETEEDKWGFIDENGKVVISPDYYEVNNFSEGIALVAKKEYKDKDSLESEIKFGFIDKKGNTVIKFKKDYQYFSCSDGLIPFSDNKKEWGFMDKKGERVIKPNKDFKHVQGFNNGFAGFFDGEKSGLINKKGEKVIRAKYDFIEYNNDMVFIADKEKIGFINTEGEEIIKPEYDQGSIPFLADNTFVQDGNKYILINKKGEQVTKEDYDEIGTQYMEFFFPSQKLQLAKNDYFDPVSVANKLIASISDGQLNGLTVSTKVLDIIKKYDLGKNDNNNLADEERDGGNTTPQANNQDKYPFLPNNGSNVTVNDKISDNVKNTINFYFSGNVKEPITVTRGDRWYSYQETVGYRLNENVTLLMIAYNAELSGKASGKGKIIAEKLKGKIEAAGFSLVKERSSEEEYFFKDKNGTFRLYLSLSNDSIRFQFALSNK